MYRFGTYLTNTPVTAAPSYLRLEAGGGAASRERTVTEPDHQVHQVLYAIHVTHAGGITVWQS